MKTRFRKRTLDIGRLGRALSGPGLDTRVWYAQGTVGYVQEDGEFRIPKGAGSRVEARNTYYTDRLGSLVSVRLEPSETIVTARWNGISCGAFGNMLFPVRPGDEVLVSIPDGDMASAGISVVAVLANRVAQLRTTRWDNDSVLFDLAVPFVIRAPSVNIDSSNLVLQGRPVLRSPGNKSI